MSRGAGLAVALAFLAGATAAGAASADERLDAFRAVCIPDRQDYDATKERAAAEGWTTVAGDSNADLKAVLAKSAAVVAGPGMAFTLESFGKAVAGRPAFLVVTFVRSERMDLVGCYYYDFDADAPLDPKLLTDWLGEAPVESVDRLPDIVAQQWETPTNLDGSLDIHSTFLPPGSQYESVAGFTGLVLKVTSVDPKDG